MGEQSSGSRRADPRGRVLALAVSVAAHVLIFWLMLGEHGMGGTLATGRGLDGEGAMEVSLVGPNTQAQEAQAAPTIDHAQSLLERLQGQDGGPPIPPDAPVSSERPKASLSDLFDEASALKPVPSGRALGKAPGGQVASAVDKVASGGPASPSAGAVAGSLWGAIEPCWRGVNAPAGVAINLQIELDSAGRLKSPPKILRRPDLRVQRDQLVAEADALQALAACLPRANKKFTGVFMLDFNGKGGSSVPK